jgi:(E)-4-hydroxy-3-methylbut-2-enyl-diphosphate synthase
VNCGSVDPNQKELFDSKDSIGPMLASAIEHCELLDSIGFTRYVVSLKDSDPTNVVTVNKRFAELRPDIPLHLGVTEAGLPPDGIIKTRIAFEQLIGRGIGDTIRVSLTVPRSKRAGKSSTTSVTDAFGPLWLWTRRSSTSSRAQVAPASKTKLLWNWLKM